MMSNYITNLLKERYFLPLFICQLFAGFGENFIRTAILAFFTYCAVPVYPSKETMVMLSFALFMLPYCGLSGVAGQLGDAYNKAAVIKWIKLCNVAIAIMAIFGFLWESPIILLVSLFLLGVQSSLFGAVKYSILPEALSEKELSNANGLIESSTFIAIVIGSMCGGLSVSGSQLNTKMVVLLIALNAMIAYISALFIPSKESKNGSMMFSFNIISATIECVRYSRQNRGLYMVILGISWFWLVGGVFLSQIPILTSDKLNGDESVFTLILTAFCIGTAIGSIYISKVVRNSVDLNLVPTSIVLMTLVSLDMLWSVDSYNTCCAGTGQQEGIHFFLSRGYGMRLVIDFLFLGIFGGMYIVPLCSYLQCKAQDAYRSRVIAASNIISSFFVVCANLVCIVLIYMGLDVYHLLLILTWANLITAVYACRILPDTVLKSIARMILRTLYRVEVRGLENYDKAGDRVLIIANHASFIDPVLICAFIPGDLVFAIDTYIAKSWWIRPLLMLVRALPIDPTNPMSTKTLIDKLKANKTVVIFPEGRITVTGSLMKVYEGPGLVAEKAGAKLLPIRIEGPEISMFSRMKNVRKLKFFPKIKMTIMEPRQIVIDKGDQSGREKRHAIGDKLYDIMSDMMFMESQNTLTVFRSFLQARAEFGGRHIILNDINKKPMSYNKTIIASVILGKKLADSTELKEMVGVLLPNMIGTVVTMLALVLHGRVPAMLNFSIGSTNVIHCCKIARIKTVYTSKVFVQKGELQGLITAIENTGIKVLYLEDIKQQIGILDKIIGMCKAFRVESYHNKVTQGSVSSHDAAFILFTSGSEGMPKGVALSHTNVISNMQQVSSRIDFNSSDVLFNALPMFHSFGLTMGTILPLLSGVETFLYPSPLHYRVIPEMVYGVNATILFGADTFLSGYAKYAHPYDFFNIRYVFAGAERLKDETLKIWGEKFGIRILEGYGVTEASPVVAVNTPMYFKIGTVGKLLPEISYKLVDVEGIDYGKKLLIKGPNIMLGYLAKDYSGNIEKLPDGWHDTGDIVQIDDEGYITIVGRSKRFAKLGGEMISLATVEEVLSGLYPEVDNAAIAVDDPTKGEALVVYLTDPNITKTEIIASIRDKGYSELLVPKYIKYIEEIPVLGVGKTDYVRLSQMFENNSVSVDSSN